MRRNTGSFDKKDLKGEYLNGAYSELADILDIEEVIKLYEIYRGTQVFFPVELFNRRFIAGRIIEEYNGHNVRELAAKYGYTEKWVRKILKGKNEAVF